jgi:hypothetical protein
VLEFKYLLGTNKGVPPCSGYNNTIFDVCVMYVGRSADLLQTAVLEVIKSPEHGQPVKELCSIGLGRQGSKRTLQT